MIVANMPLPYGHRISDGMFDRGGWQRYMDFVRMKLQG